MNTPRCFPGRSCLGFLAALGAWIGTGFCTASEHSPADLLKAPPVLEDRSARVEAEGLSPSTASENNPLTVPFVEGSESFGIRIPDIDSATGKMRSLLEIGALARVDDRLLEIKESFLQIYKSDGSPQFSIRFPKATLDRFTRRLKSHGPVLIWTENFRLDGVSMELDTVSREAVFDGHVRMVIYQLGASLPSVGSEGEGDSARQSSRSDRQNEEVDRSSSKQPGGEIK